MNPPTNDNWLEQVQRQYIGGNPKYDFPPRPLGWARLLGVVFIGFGVFFAWTPAHTAVEFIHKLANGDRGIGSFIFGLFPLIFVAVALMPMGIGLMIIFGRTRVEWRDGQLSSAEVLGPFRWTRRLPRQPIRKLEVATPTSSTNGSAPKPVESFATLMAEYDGGVAKVVVFGYPRVWLLGVAEELRKYVSGGREVAVEEAVGSIGATAGEDGEDELQQPADSQVLVENLAAGVRLSEPPAGIWKGSKGLMFFALFWCGFMTVFTTVMVTAGKNQAHGQIWVMILFVGVFWSIGIGLLIQAINMGRRTATFTVENDRLRIETKNIFGTKQLEFGRGEIAAIRADASGMKINNRPVMELQIYPVSGKKTGLLGGRDYTELKWMATRLRQALKVSARKPGT